jgi:hypothetical protein
MLQARMPPMSRTAHPNAEEILHAIASNCSSIAPPGA